ncbi:hypothetical protein HELRODRAFT_68387, partial [Helobdella robusta]|uniref:Leucine zipper transcription factor-like protein 1 n=1 Tax=Helobdella robusta TaxID=6412 RepID=T1FZD8_HELRO
ASLGINEHHENIIINYLRFSKYQKGLRLKSVDASFSDMESSRLQEDTYTIDEVKEIIECLNTLVRADVETELIHTSHTVVLMLVQLFQQAEKWHLKLQPDISELENRQYLLEKIKQFEEKTSRGDGEPKPAARLEPMNESGTSALLKMEIEKLNELNSKLKEKLKFMEDQAIQSKKDNSQLKSDLEDAIHAMIAKKDQKNIYTSKMETHFNEFFVKFTQLVVQKSQMTSNQVSEMQSDLAKTKHQLLEVNEMLEMAEKELEKKVSQTTPFKNLKTMVQKKNEQIKELRKKLSKYITVDFFFNFFIKILSKRTNLVS